MKSVFIRIVCIIGVFGLSGLPGCNDEYLEGGPYYGFTTANMNGEPWSGKIRGTEQNNLLGISIETHSNEGFLMENLSLTKIPKVKGVYNIPKTDTLNIYALVTSSYFTLDSDAILDSYFVDANNPTHFVEITSFDAQTEILAGKFQVSLVRDSRRAKFHPSIPDTIRFTNGSFKTKVLLKN